MSAPAAEDSMPPPASNLYRFLPLSKNFHEHVLKALPPDSNPLLPVFLLWQRDVQFKTSPMPQGLTMLIRSTPAKDIERSPRVGPSPLCPHSIKDTLSVTAATKGTGKLRTNFPGRLV